jgi:hypothetical protein
MKLSKTYAIFRCIYQENSWSMSAQRGKREGLNFE